LKETGSLEGRVATIQDIANKVGVSKGVVSAYLNDPTTSRVGPETKHKIDHVVEKLGYVPNVHARNLSAGRTNLMTVLVLFREPLFRNSVVNEILSGLYSILTRYKIGLVFPAEHAGTMTEIVEEQIKSSYGNEGCILIGTRYSSREDVVATVESLERRAVPFVVTNMPELGRSVNEVVVHGSRSADAIRHLVGLGHRRILVLGGTGTDPEGNHEEAVIRDAINELDVSPETVLFKNAGYEFRLARQVVQDALDQGHQFTAVFCLARQMAMGAAHGLSERGIAVPADVTIATIAESRFLEFYQFPFIVVETDYFRVGEEAARLVMNTVECRRQGVECAPQTVRLDSRLVLAQPSPVAAMAHGGQGAAPAAQNSSRNGVGQ